PESDRREPKKLSEERGDTTLPPTVRWPQRQLAFQWLQVPPTFSANTNTTHLCSGGCRGAGRTFPPDSRREPRASNNSAQSSSTMQSISTLAFFGNPETCTVTRDG